MLIINVATEDELSETVARKIISDFLPNYEIGLCLRKGGNGYLRSNIHKFCQMARRQHVLMLTDLDNAVCPSALISAWRGNLTIPEALLLRVCVREVESWLLADRQGFAELLGISHTILPPNPDELDDPKAFLLHVARRGLKNVRQGLLPARGTTAPQGLGYNRILCSFVEDFWSIERAINNSNSLKRAVMRIAALGGPAS